MGRPDDQEVIQGLNARPNLKPVGRAVSETVKLTRDDFEQRLGGQFDPNRYRGVVEAIFGSSVAVGVQVALVHQEEAGTAVMGRDVVCFDFVLRRSFAFVVK